MIAYRGDDRDLPWGWWLRVNGPFVEDEEGGRWDDVRDAFWRGRLNMPRDRADRGMEMLLRTLGSLDAPKGGLRGLLADVFGGAHEFRDHYLAWLVSVGLLEDARPEWLSGPRIGAEGRSVLLMLRATRHHAWVPLTTRELLEAFRTLDRTGADGARECTLRGFEAGISGLPWIFAREDVGTSFAVTLTGVDGDLRMPIRRVVWSVTLPDRRTRDDLFGWLAARVDRWEDWGGLVRSHGAQGLTNRLLALLVADPPPTCMNGIGEPTLT